MKHSRIIFVFTFCLSGILFGTCQPPSHYNISGVVGQVEADGQVILSSFDPVSQVKTPLDTATLAEDGSYQLQFAFSEPDLFRVDFFRAQSVMLAIDAGQKDITLHVEGVKNGAVEIIGSPDAQKLQGYEKFRVSSYERLIKPTYDAMRAATDGGEQAAEIEAVDAYAQATAVHRSELIDYTREHIGTSIALYGTVLRWTGDEEIAKLEDLVADFKKAHLDLKMTAVMEAKVQRYKKVAIGESAPEIAEPDTSGLSLSLYASLGKYTLIDFWASWCRPCLLQAPDLRAVYEKYHDRGFEIFSVSVDTREKRWKGAIEKYELDWLHVSQLKGWKSASARDYNATFVPYNLLIDEEGRIIAKNLHSKALDGMLQKLFEEEE